MSFLDLTSVAQWALLDFQAEDFFDFSDIVSGFSPKACIPRLGQV